MAIIAEVIPRTTALTRASPVKSDSVR